MDIKSNLSININPSRADINSIEAWLVEEDKKYKEGFYCNWNIISDAFNDKRLIALNYNKLVIGFVIWRRSEIHAEIDILEIHRDYRIKGIGRCFYERIATYFKKENLNVVKLFCAPRESEFFWRKLNFIKFPDRGYSESDLTFYKPLIDIALVEDNPDDNNKLELWNLELYEMYQNAIPLWVWSIPKDINRTLEKPIIQPCNDNWNMRWTNDGKVIKEDKVKYFSESENRIDFSPFLFVERLDI